MIETFAARITFVAFHDRGPLASRHRPSARVSEEVDQNIFRRKKEEIVVRGFEQLLTLATGGPADRFDGLDAEGFDYRLHRHRTFLDRGNQERSMLCAVEVPLCDWSHVRT